MRMVRAPILALSVLAAGAAFAAETRTRSFGGDKRALAGWSVVSAELGLAERADFHGLDLTDVDTRLALLEAADLGGLKPELVLKEPSAEKRLELVLASAQAYARGVTRMATADPSWLRSLERAHRLRASLPEQVRGKIEAARRQWEKGIDSAPAPERDAVLARAPAEIRRHELRAAPKVPWMTPALAAANAGIYHAQTHAWFDAGPWGFHVHHLSDAVARLDFAGAGAAALTALSSLFLHNFDLHLWLNLGGLLAYGLTLELLLGRKRFLTLYLVSGLLAVAA